MSFRFEQGPRMRLVAVLALVAALGGACGHDQSAYCQGVSGYQTELTTLIDEGKKDALIQVLPIFEDLQSTAPADVRDDWQVVVTRIRALKTALDNAGVDPATYDRAHPPAGVSNEDRQLIDRAAAGVGSSDVSSALDALQQEARDVCHTPLTLD